MLPLPDSHFAHPPKVPPTLAEVGAHQSASNVLMVPPRGTRDAASMTTSGPAAGSCARSEIRSSPGRLGLVRGSEVRRSEVEQLPAQALIATGALLTPRCELLAARSFKVIGAGHYPAAVCRRRSRPMALLYSCAVRLPAQPLTAMRNELPRGVPAARVVALAGAVPMQDQRVVAGRGGVNADRAGIGG